MFRLGNHVIDEILQGVATDFKNKEIFYTVDQLSGATITITSDPREITDKNGNVVKRVYKSKNGEFASTSAFLHPAIMNAGSGSTLEYASQEDMIAMPKIVEVAAGGTLDVTDAANNGAGIRVIGVFGNGANSKNLSADTTASYTDADPKFGLADGILTVPAKADNAPVKYIVYYYRDKDSGIKLTNTADKFPDSVTLTLLVSYIDPCSETLKPAYVVLPNFMADPSVTLNLSSENQEMDFNGTLQVDYCSGTKVLYYIYYPDEGTVESGETDGDGTEGN